MCASPQNPSAQAATKASTQNGPAPERLDEEFSYRQERYWEQNLGSVGWAKSAQPSSRFLYSKTAAPKLHQTRLAPKNQNPQNGQHWARFDWGFGAFCFGASSVAAVFGSAPGSATSPKHHSQTKPSPTNPPAKPDISTWQDLGHFYLALTPLFSAVAFPHSRTLKFLSE